MQALSPILMMVLMFGVFYFILIRPQVKRQRETQEMLKKLDKGDTIITRGGIIGKITGSNGDVLVVAQADIDREGAADDDLVEVVEGEGSGLQVAGPFASVAVAVEIEGAGRSGGERDQEQGGQGGRAIWTGHGLEPPVEGSAGVWRRRPAGGEGWNGATGFVS